MIHWSPMSAPPPMSAGETKAPFCTIPAIHGNSPVAASVPEMMARDSPPVKSSSAEISAMNFTGEGDMEAIL
jgi:hypothetical protein